MIIYKITNTLNGKIYIGQTVQTIEDRWHDHSRPRRGKHTFRSAIASAITLHGKENFTIEQIDDAKSLEELNIKEATYIKALNTIAPNGYNLHLGGDSKLCHDETKEKIRNTLKGRPIANRWTGGNRAPRTDEQKANLSAKIKGKPNVALHKQVVCVQTGVIYESVNAAAKSHDVNRVTITGLLKSGKIGVRMGVRGFSFRFA